MAKEKILVVRLDRLGDLLQTLPAIQALQAVGQYAITAGIAPLYLPLVKDWLPIDWLGLEPASPPAVFDKIRAGRFGRLVCFSFEKNARQVLPKLRFIPQRYGNANNIKAFWLFNHRIYQKRSHALHSEAIYGGKLLTAFGFLPEATQLPKVCLPTQASIRVNSWLESQGLVPKKFVIIHQGMSGSALNCPPGFYFDLAERLTQQGLRIVLTGQGPKELEANHQLAKVLPIANSTGLWDVTELAALLSMAQLVIAPSTGVLHLANAVGSEIFGLFSPILVQAKHRWAPHKYIGAVVDPLDYSPILCPASKKCWGLGCQHYSCMEKIPALRVAEQIMGILGPAFPKKG